MAYFCFMAIRTLSELLRLLKDLKALLADDSNANIAANDCLQLVKDRVINTGKDRFGIEFSDRKGRTAYSDKKYPIHYYIDAPTRGINKKKVDELMKRVGFYASYADWREQNNLRTDHVNFQFTGDMWRTTVISTATRAGMFIAIFDSSNPETISKIENLNDIYINFMAPSEEELYFTAESWTDPVIDFLKQNFN